MAGLTSENSQTNSAQEENGQTSPQASQKRQRAKHACEPCRLRKRKCDSNLPCNMCSQFEYKCFYPRKKQKRSKLVEQNAYQQDELHRSEAYQQELAEEDQGSLEDMSKLRAQEANSGIAFTRLLGMRLDPSARPKFSTFGWNLGNGTYVAPNVKPITSLITLSQMVTMASLYFANVHPIYGFLDQASFMRQLSARWTDSSTFSLPDHLMANVAAVGALFSDGQITSIIPSLVESAKLALEGTSTIFPPALVDVQSWVLRCLYLRIADHPHAVWMATSTTMHLIEATGIHQEASNTSLHLAAPDIGQDAELRRRTFWVARMLNTWVSFEYGRTRVSIRGITAKLPTPRDGDFTMDYINLYSMSCCLDPERTNQASQWEDFLRQLEAFEAPHDGIELSRANLGLCGYRRLRLVNPILSQEVIYRIIKICLSGMDAARRFAEKRMPWWHVANVPFQCICVFLAMDTRESLPLVATAMRTLEYVVERFETTAMKEALKTARFLIRLSKKRKDEDSMTLSQSLHKDNQHSSFVPDEHNPNRSVILEQVPVHNQAAVVMNGLGNTPNTSSSTEDWNLDVLNNSQFDWNYFFTGDMPAFNSFAPDGIM